MPLKQLFLLFLRVLKRYRLRRHILGIRLQGVHLLRTVRTADTFCRCASLFQSSRVLSQDHLQLTVQWPSGTHNMAGGLAKVPTATDPGTWRKHTGLPHYHVQRDPVATTWPKPPPTASFQGQGRPHTAQPKRLVSSGHGFGAVHPSSPVSRWAIEPLFHVPCW